MVRTNTPIDVPTTELDCKSRVRDRDEDDEAANKMPRTEKDDAGCVKAAKTTWEAWLEAEKQRRKEAKIQNEVDRMTADLLSHGVATLKWRPLDSYDKCMRGIALFWKELQLTQTPINERGPFPEGDDPLDNWFVDWARAAVGEVAESELRDHVRSGIEQALAKAERLLGGV